MAAVTAPPTTYETLAESAERHRCSTKTLRRRIAEGKLTAYRFGPHLIRLDPAEVDALLRPIPSAAAGGGLVAGASPGAPGLAQTPSYADPTGETAVRNVLREARR